VSSLPQHPIAKAWLDARLNQPALVGMPWPSLLGFARLVCNPRVFERPVTLDAAWRQVESWLDCPVVRIPLATERHRAALSTLLPAAASRASLIPDAHLAALAIEHGLTLVSTDGDFARFPGLRWENPLAKRGH
jgi:toxin-antitoxin system PIN domain toxin